GGINAETAAAVREAGADILVAGSSVFRGTDKAANIRALRG
ncbi:MAG: ribulose-phosphate 3-epimerase, partial [Clostridia bacterium]|nr:ribulose-phosphate 3-epimerase [Clostridia bacterium]